MAHAFKPSRLVGLLALLVCLTSTSATTAQAETGAYWEIGLSKEIKGWPYGVNAEIEGFNVVLLTKSGLTKVEISCTSTSLWAFNSLEALGGFKGSIHYNGCTTKLNGGAPAAACKPHSPGALEGLIETRVLSGLLKLHTGGVNLLELSPFAGGPFVTLQFGTGECALGNNIEINGKAFVKDAQGEVAVNKVTHLVQEGPLSALLFGANAATIDGSAVVSLRGEYAGFKWSGHPN